jgi:hypothetical protein
MESPNKNPGDKCLKKSVISKYLLSFFYNLHDFQLNISYDPRELRMPVLHIPS